MQKENMVAENFCYPEMTNAYVVNMTREWWKAIKKFRLKEAVKLAMMDAGCSGHQVIECFWEYNTPYEYREVIYQYEYAFPLFHELHGKMRRNYKKNRLLFV